MRKPKRKKRNIDKINREPGYLLTGEQFTDILQVVHNLLNKQNGDQRLFLASSKTYSAVSSAKFPEGALFRPRVTPDASFHV